MAVVTAIPEELAAKIGALPDWAGDGGKWLADIIEKHKSWLNEEGIATYQAAYDGYLESVENREKDRGDDINYKLQVNYAQLIIDTVTDYLTGKPIVWTVEKPEEEGVDQKTVDEYKKEILKLLRSQAAQRIFAEQLRQGSIAGYSAIISWVDEKGRIDYDEFPVQEVVPVYDVRGRLLLLVRYYDVEEGTGEQQTTVTKVEVYDDQYVTYYTQEEGGSFVLDGGQDNPVKHLAGRIPVSLFINGTPARHEKRQRKNGTSDLGNGVLSLLEAYAHGMSDKANMADRLQDAYLKLQGVDTDEKEVRLMRKARAIQLKGAVGVSDATFIAQDQEDKAVENNLNRLRDTIHDQTQTPKLADLSGATATEVKMKYAGLDIKAGKKELYFVEAIQQHIAVLTDLLNARRLIEAGVEDPYPVLAGVGTSSLQLYNPEWLTVTVNRNLPQNFKEIADIVAALAGKVPDAYLYELLWFIDDPVEALEEMKAQKDEEADRTATSALGFGSTFSRGGTNTDSNNADDGGGGQ